MHGAQKKAAERKIMATPTEVLTFWFGHSHLDQPADKAHRQLWFAGGRDFDRRIQERFGPVVELALTGELDSWRGELAGELALILVCDQFTRNIHRGTGRAFDGDPLALNIAQTVIDRKQDRQLGLDQRAFLGMPLEHSEDPAVQEQSVAYFERLRRDYRTAAPDAAAQAASYYQYALAHQKVIQEFRRYPHRNAALGRDSTPPELEWLAQGGGF